QKGKKHKKHKNSHAREVTLQALYQIDVVNQSLETVLKLSWLNEEPASAEKSYIYTLIEGIAEYQDEIDDVVDSFSDKDSTQISTIVRSILRIGVFEIMKGELEPGIVIDDLLDLTRKYDGEESVAFVNGILDSFKIEKNKQEQA
ncbi:MAG: transcription antitermination factor NusB, partial [Spirochaetia bacterium]|nr:transcription antitermination factor NusB [Spirochaetia bacterium]